ncbi:MAG: chorismate-binding protein [Treponema berlinense]|uniref:anthranilate synthase component I family protein n=1 Tax=Treponema berlinense TaxID=225004 RepID=UPI0023F32B5C|nr:chorismate-binding protein [Treponema berlinense]MDD5834513.1 chorismate-binding protein [Treponema berlinense]
MADFFDSVYKCISSERYTPYSLARKIGAVGILESASFAKGRERYSILMAEEAFKIVQDDDGVAFLIDGSRVPFVPVEDSLDALGRKKPADILDALLYVARQHKNFENSSDIPVPASGMGYLSYEFARRCDNIRFFEQEDELGVPESLFIAGHIYIVFDHFTETMHIFGFNYKEHKIDIEVAVEKMVKRINDMDFSYVENEIGKFEYKILTDIEQSKREYIQKVEELKKHIVDGDIIQAVPSRRVQIECKATALQVYGKLRKVNPSPYMFYLDFGNFQLTGASPESLVRVREGKASIHPIAGTIHRGKNEAEDEELSKTLRENPKERAEHLMLVDLARNDLGRVCKSGSVTVPQYMECERYSHVIHLVSNTEGFVREGVKPIQVLRASFPAGTVSGAPKISAMQILSRLEKIKRRFYAGAVGYIQNNGDLDFCITIRSCLCKDGIFSLQAGGGIVYDSTPEREFTETQEKLGALIDTLTK